jgi:hypothetical protein
LRKIPPSLEKSQDFLGVIVGTRLALQIGHAEGVTPMDLHLVTEKSKERI